MAAAHAAAASVASLPASQHPVSPFSPTQLGKCHTNPTSQLLAVTYGLHNLPSDVELHPSITINLCMSLLFEHETFYLQAHTEADRWAWTTALTSLMKKDDDGGRSARAVRGTISVVGLGSPMNGLLSPGARGIGPTLAPARGRSAASSAQPVSPRGAASSTVSSGGSISSAPRTASSSTSGATTSPTNSLGSISSNTSGGTPAPPSGSGNNANEVDLWTADLRASFADKQKRMATLLSDGGMFVVWESAKGKKKPQHVRCVMDLSMVRWADVADAVKHNGQVYTYSWSVSDETIIK
jgi:hypothetical protein